MNEKIVLGTWPLSGDWGPVDVKEVINILETAYFKYGFKEFDTAPNYGNGFSEFILGKIFHKEKEILFNTKVGNFPFGQKSFNTDHIKRSISESLKRLNCEKINTVFLHNPRDEVKNYDTIIQLLKDFKSQGIVKYIGLSCAKSFNYDGYLDKTQFDFIQDDINLICLDPLINKKKERIYARSPLASGLLSGNISPDTIFNKYDHRSDWLKGERLNSICKRINEIKKIEPSVPIIDIAQRFLYHNERIHKTIYGIKKVSHIKMLVDLGRSTPLKLAQINKIYSLYNNDYGLEDEESLGY